MWSNKKPTEDGVYWYVKKIWENGIICPITPPTICYISEYRGDTDVMFIGDDCPDELPGKETMVLEYSRTLEPTFMFDSPEEKERKRKNVINIKEEVWLIKVEEPEFKE